MPPKIGDPVLCDGRTHLVTDGTKAYSREHDALIPLIIFEDPTFKVTAQESDLRWDDELKSWYLWGRCLSAEEQAVVIELRDRHLLPARATRTPGNPPAGGEHLNLYKSLFFGKAKGFWNPALIDIRSGKKPSTNHLSAISDYTERFKKKLTTGYADPDADDSDGEA